MATITGTEGDDIIPGTPDVDVIDGLAGDDAISGGASQDRIFGGLGDDRLFGNDAFDFLHGEDGNDILDGGAGADELFGDAGDDVLILGADGGRASGGTGSDRFVFELQVDRQTQSWNILDLSTASLKDGGDVVDLAALGIGDRATFLELLANTGTAAVFRNDVPDFYSLGVTFFQAARANYRLDIVQSNDRIVGTAGRDDLFGSLGDDFLEGGEGNDRLFGEQGNDELRGGGGQDLLFGGTGADVLFEVGGGDRAVDRFTGGAEADRFVLAQEAGEGQRLSLDVITDFQVGIDRLDLTAVVRALLGLAPGASPLGTHVTFADLGFATRVLIDRDGAGAQFAPIEVVDLLGVRAADLSARDVIFPTNRAPTALAISNLAVNETAAPGTVIGNVSATDPDGDPVTFFLTGNADGRFAVVNGQLITLEPLDFETGASFTVTLSASDGRATSVQDFVVQVIDVDEAAEPTLTFSQGIAGLAPPSASNGPLADAALVAALVARETFAIEETSFRTVENEGAWTAIRNLDFRDFGPGEDSNWLFANFTDVQADFRPAETGIEAIIVGARRGLVQTGSFDDRVEWVLHTADRKPWNIARVETGAGNDAVILTTVARSDLDDRLLADNADPRNGRFWNGGYDGLLSNATVELGAGDDFVSAEGFLRLTARGGLGRDTLIGGEGNDILDGGAGMDALEGGRGADRFILQGLGQTWDDVIVDFSRAEGDRIELFRFGGRSGLVEESPGFYQVVRGGVVLGQFVAAAGLELGVDIVFT
jgi:Ca2+-binding RTX toxin-like protein